MDIILFDKIMNTGDFIFNTYISKPNFKESQFIDLDEENYIMTLKPIIQNITKFPIVDDRKIKLFEDSLDNINDNQNFNLKLNDFTNKALELYNILFGVSNSSINYVSSVIYFLNTYNLLNNIWDTNFNIKVFCLGTGDFYKQAFPNFVINKIKSGHKIEIILFDDCNDDGFGCPDSFNEWLKFLTKEPILLTKENLANLKITVIKQKISVYTLIYSLIDKITSISKCFIIFTISAGHTLISLIDYINKINTFLKKSDKIFYDEYILGNKLIYYLSTGSKIILFNKEKQEFEGYQIGYEFKTNCKRKEVNMVCELDFFDDDDIYNNNYQKIINKISGRDSKQKYLKYKSKYLMLKKLLNPYN